MSKGDDISIQVSLYPLEDTDITEAIFNFLDIFRSHGLDYDLGSMSTVISGKTSVVFRALEDAYRMAAEDNRFVLVCTMSNAVPTEKDLEELRE
ncbi:MAG: Ykof family thiamine-binding protein [Candidatus Marinimicrobia bacterium]|nr:Ykof family thiamine-binding protein [Candidatus Neomarinimicrobiota bacterium]MCF7828538.1 Ykof family thiamine-binding protein [Candidatus Neomarinimicrobiota bacterium]MCF7882039.1 Ykof family thiamine-binding protein [Candidatus Neomarinimicrobiota bacterium]